MLNESTEESLSGVHSGKTLEEWRDFYEEHYNFLNRTEFVKKANHFCGFLRNDVYYRVLKTRIHDKFGPWTEQFYFHSRYNKLVGNKTYSADLVYSLYSALNNNHHLLSYINRKFNKSFTNDHISSIKMARFHTEQQQMLLDDVLVKKKRDEMLAQAIVAHTAKYRSTAVYKKTVEKEFHEFSDEWVQYNKTLESMGVSKRAAAKVLGEAYDRGDARIHMGMRYIKKSLVERMREICETSNGGYLDAPLVYRPDLVSTYQLSQMLGGLEKNFFMRVIVKQLGAGLEYIDNRCYINKYGVEKAKEILNSVEPERRRFEVDYDRDRGRARKRGAARQRVQTPDQSLWNKNRRKGGVGG